MVLKCFNLPSSPPSTRGHRKKGYRAKVSMDLFRNSSLWSIPICTVRKPAVQFTWISSGGSIQSQTNTIHEPAMAVQYRRNCKALPVGPVCGSDKKLSEDRRKFVGALPSRKSQQQMSRKESKENQCQSIISENQCPKNQMKTSK